MSEAPLTPEVSFVVIAYNEEAHVAETVRSILAQRDVGPYEILVVDDGSRDATARVVADCSRMHREVRLVRHETNRGRGAARASGVEAACGRFVAMVDADISLPPEWWATCRTALDHYDVVGGTAVPDGDVAYVHRISGLRPKVREASTVVTGNNGAYRAEVLRHVAFDPTLADGEDIAINHALRAAGYRLLCIPGLLVEHREDKDLRRSLAWLFESGVGSTRQLATYRELRAPDVAAAGWGVVLLGSLAFSRRQPARASAAFGGYLLLAAAAHLVQRFVLDARRPDRLARALAADAALLLAYFCGRIWGVPVYVAHRGLACRAGADRPDRVDR